MSQECALLLNCIGIVIEIIGAVYLLFCSWRSKQSVSTLKTDIDNIEVSVSSLLREVSEDFNNQRIGFAFFLWQDCLCNY